MVELCFTCACEWETTDNKGINTETEIIKG